MRGTRAFLNGREVAPADLLIKVDTDPYVEALYYRGELVEQPFTLELKQSLIQYFPAGQRARPLMDAARGPIWMFQPRKLPEDA